MNKHQAVTAARSSGDLQRADAFAPSEATQGDEETSAEVMGCLAALASEYNETALLEPGALAAVYQMEGPPPVFAFRFQDEPITDTNFQLYLSQLEALYQTEDAFCLVLDLTHLRWPSLRYSWKQIAFLREHTANMRRCVIWSALVVNSSEMRHLLQTIFTVVPPQRPVYVIDAVTIGSGTPESGARKIR